MNTCINQFHPECNKSSRSHTGKKPYSLLTTTVTAAALWLVASVGYADQRNQESGSKKSDEVLEEVVVTGTRRQGRTALTTAAPVDVISGSEISNQGGTDLNDLLRNIVPSYNVNTQPISDAATLVKPANLRGLAPDHTLVLVNGKRRHRASVIYWQGNGVSDGAQGPDIANIPSIALKQVEVLRDGAAAQYGSDAIAGVMNFLLKDTDEGVTIEARTGQFFEGDGATNAIAANFGLGLGNDGFANLSFELGNTDDTQRSIERADVRNLINSGYTGIVNPPMVWGQPIIDDDIKFIANVGVNMNDSMSWYLINTYASKNSEGSFYFRVPAGPTSRGGVFIDGSDNRPMADLDGPGGVNCPVLANPTTMNPANGAADRAAIAALNANCFVFNKMFPNGFTPRFGADVEDLALVTGLKGEFANGMTWDTSLAYGSNEADFFIYNTINASMGPNTPTSFDPGAYKQTDTNLNFDVSYPVVGTMNIAAGFEYRNEEFEVTQGEEASWIDGPFATDGFSPGSNGFVGFPPLAAGTFSRDNIALYGDMEWDPVDSYTFGFALRWEDFEDFGTTSNFKISNFLKASDAIAFRMTYSTGFRAPTPGQSNAFNVSTEIDGAVLVNRGTIPSINPVAQLRGGSALEPEESVNTTLGAILSLGDMVDISIDLFKIKLEDRLGLTQDFQLTAPETAALVASGVTYASAISEFRFFSNGFDTNTEGLDFVAALNFTNSTNLTFAFNKTTTRVTSFITGLIDQSRIRELQEGLPGERYNLTYNQSMDKLRFLARISHYDGWWDSDDGFDSGAETLLDLEAAYSVSDAISITLGAQNVTETTPDSNPLGSGSNGNEFSQYSPFGFSGGYYYLRLKYEM